MTINLSDNTPRVSYTVAQGATQTSFTVSFEFFASADLKVYVDGTLKTITTHYTVSGGNGSTGAVAISVTGATGGSTVVITRDIALERTTDFPAQGSFQIATLNTELDKITAQFADRKDDVDRSLRLEDSDSAVAMTLPLKASRVGTVLGFNASTGAPEAGPTIANVNSLSAITANINTVAGISANVTTVAGISANTTTVAGIASNVTAVAGNTSNINALAASAVLADMALLATSDVISDMALLATSDVISDMNTLATSDIVSDLNALATSDIVSDMNALATSDIISDMNALATSDIISDLNALATSDIISDMNLLATSAVIADMASLAGSGANPNITTLTASGEIAAASLDISGNVDVDGTLEADDITINGAAIASVLSPVAGSSSIITTGALNAGSITSGFGQIDNGSSAITTTGIITGGTLEATTDTAAGDNAAIGYTAAEGLILTGQGSTSDITLKNDADATVFTVPTGTDDILFPDSAKAMFGAGSDLQIYHDGSNSYIVDNGTGDLVINTNGNAISLNPNGGGEYGLRVLNNGAVNLYHDNALKLATTATGATISGDLLVDGADPEIVIQDTNDTGDAFIRFKNNSGTQRSFIQTAMTGDVMLFGTGTTEAMRISSGKVGIGTTSPAALLTMVAADGVMADQYVAKFTNSEATAGQNYGVFVAGGSTSADESFSVRKFDNSATYFKVRGDGNVGIGEASPDTQLHISSGAPVFRMEDTDTNRYIDFLYGTRVATLRNTLASGEDMDTVHPEIRFDFTDANETRNLFRIIGDNGIPRMSSAHTFTLADDSTVTIHGASAGSAGSSLFAVYEHGSGYGALVHVNYGTSTVINNSNGTQYVTTDTDGKYGCILTSNHGITFKNRAGATKTYSMSVFGSYMIGQS